MAIDPDKVPATPVYTITVTANGADIDGEPVHAPAGDSDAARREALSEIQVKAALRGRPVRVTAKEIDGTSWAMIVDSNGDVVTLDAPHPAPPAVPPTHAPQPPVVHAPHPPAGHAPHPPAAPATPHAPHVGAVDGPPPAGHAPQLAPPAGAAANPQPATPWAAPLPPAYQDAYERLRAAHAAGDLPSAVVAADRLETALEAEYGPLHPHTVNMLTVRAWLTLSQRTDWFDTVELLIRTALRRHEAGAEPAQETVRAVQNAHGAWRVLTTEDPDGAMELCEMIAGALDRLGETRRTQDVLNWVEESRMGIQKVG
ncbi:hypothetical protein [Streptomyces hydrogenans]|uniref:hypothetical protein n=1 Tax=Streptomyces hydrogenans TaxID=1873719 RepID=UPI003D75F581